MRVATNHSGQRRTTTGIARQAMYEVAAKLHDLGFGIRLPKDGSRHLVIVNATRAYSEITVADDGYVTWDYWPWTGATTDPADLAGVALSLLGPAPTDARPSVSRVAFVTGGVVQPDFCGGWGGEPVSVRQAWLTVSVLAFRSMSDQRRLSRRDDQGLPRQLLPSVGPGGSWWHTLGLIKWIVRQQGPYDFSAVTASTSFGHRTPLRQFP